MMSGRRSCRPGTTERPDVATERKFGGSRFDQANHETTVIDRIRALLRLDDNVSFAELDELDGFRGTLAIELAENIPAL
ncbi:MAG TPA: hypothetical protein VGR70_09845 [Stellaceae bacterium]|nr:hypothetical protein [Stellaceae bacterium]